MITVNTHEAKTNFSHLMRTVEENQETVILCRNGHPIAEILPLKKRKRNGLPEPEPGLALDVNYDPTEPLDDDYLPEVCR